jgi:sulfite exporter TauE/SafE
MIDLPLAFLGGLLGSAHCVGMCGPLALTLGAGTQAFGTNFRRQLVYGSGRIFTYACFGAVAGFASLWLASKSRSLVHSQAWLAVGAGVLLIIMGLATAGVLPRPAVRVFGHAPCSAARAVKTFLTAPNWASVFLAGVATGFLPCGLVYAFVLKAGSTGSIWMGGLTMALFGLGTVPLMTVAGVGGLLLSVSARARVIRLAAWCVVLAGAVTVFRGTSHLRVAARAPTAACPFCAAAAE